MNTVSNIGQNLAMDGRKYLNSVSTQHKGAVIITEQPAIADSAKVVENLVQNNANVEEDVKQLQKLSDMVMGRKLQFNVNKELGSVVIKIMDPSTNQVIKEIPSEDMQKLKVRIRRAIGLLFDELI
ncbi:MAG: flagellar protein FlaG [Treponema sp.]|nr:flagellar protein FlaG [Treponema sp.]